VSAFRDAFCAYAAARLDGKPRQHTLQIDAEVPLAALTMGLMKGVAALHPHGTGNRRPLFLAGDLKVVGEPRKCGQGERHLQFRVRQATGPILKAIAWNMAERTEELTSVGGACCLVFSPKINEWNGYTNIDLEVCDLQAGAVANLA
jgi:single-stranded-DNA-specific exonuclease